MTNWLPNWLLNWVPDARAWAFSARTFLAATLALYIGFAMDLERPYWALATVYITSQPLSGATRSKAVYRAVGTLLGAIGAVLMVPNLVDAPVLLSLAFTLWTGVCLYFALLDRTPRSYLFMLAGFTAAIIGFPSVNAPGTVFDTALARVEEITLGIACASLVASVVFPSSAGPVLDARIDAWIGPVRRWSREALSGLPETEAMRAERRRLAADLTEIDLLISYLAWDATAAADTVRWVRALRRRLVTLLPVLSSIADRVRALQQVGGLTPSVRALLDEVDAWVQAGRDAPHVAQSGLRAATRALRPDLSARSDWNSMLLANLGLRLAELEALVQDCRDLRRHIAAGGGRFPGSFAFHGARTAAQVWHSDRGMIVWSGLSAALAILICCAFWIASGWPEGATAPMMATVACCFFAAQDDPVPGILTFLVCSAISVAIDAVYLFAILPPLHDFEMLVLALAPTFLVFGAMSGMPRTRMVGTVLAANGATLMSLQSTYNADFANFANSAIALLVGVGVAVIVTAIVRSVGAAWSARRLLRAGWHDVAAAASRRGLRDRAVFAGLMLDRISLLGPRMALAGQSGDLRSVDALTDLRVGLNVVDLRRARRKLAEPVRMRVDAVLDELAAFYRRRTVYAGAEAPPVLLERLDAALSSVVSSPELVGRSFALLGLVGIRRGLFPDAPAYSPSLPTAPPRALPAERAEAG